MKTLSHALARLIPRRTKLVLVARGGVRVGVPTQTAAPHPLIRARAQESPRRIMASRRTAVPAGWGKVLAVKAVQTDATKTDVMSPRPSVSPAGIATTVRPT